MIALSTVLSMIQIPLMPHGGSITLFSMVPILVMSYRHGAKWGVMTAFVNSLIQLVQGLGNLAYCQTLTAQVGCVLLDYLLASAPAPSIRRRAGALRFYLRYFRRVAAPPRRCRSALLRANTARTCADSPGLTRTSRTETSLCTVDLLHPNAAAAARTVAPRSTMYSASCTARCSGSALIPPRPLYRAATAYAPGRAIMSARVDFCRPAALYWTRT